MFGCLPKTTEQSGSCAGNPRLHHRTRARNARRPLIGMRVRFRRDNVRRGRRRALGTDGHYVEAQSQRGRAALRGKKLSRSAWPLGRSTRENAAMRPGRPLRGERGETQAKAEAHGAQEHRVPTERMECADFTIEMLTSDWLRRHRPSLFHNRRPEPRSTVNVPVDSRRAQVPSCR
jgi:hypothetical protein